MCLFLSAWYLNTFLMCCTGAQPKERKTRKRENTKCTGQKIADTIYNMRLFFDQYILYFLSFLSSFLLVVAGTTY